MAPANFFVPEEKGVAVRSGGRTEINQSGFCVDPETTWRVWGVGRRRGADRIVGTTRSVGVLLFGPRGGFFVGRTEPRSLIYYPEY